MIQVAVISTDNDPPLLAFLDELSGDCPDGSLLLPCYAHPAVLSQIRSEADLEDNLEDGRVVLSFLCFHPGSDIPESVVRVFTTSSSIQDGSDR